MKYKAPGTRCLVGSGGSQLPRFPLNTHSVCSGLEPWNSLGGPKGQAREGQACFSITMEAVNEN